MRTSPINKASALAACLFSASSLATTYVNPTSDFSLGDGSFFGVPGNATYDYIVVGGGAAGNAVAYRLAESGEYSVAIVEAGGFYEIEGGNSSVVPLLNVEFASLNEPNAWPLTDWGFVTTLQAGANNRTLHYARGKTLGGSSALNANIYNRGSRGSYQQWADLVGDPSYEFDNFVPFFARGLNYTPANADLRAANASVPALPTNSSIVNPNGGPQQLTHSNFALPWSSWVQKAFRAFGFPDVDTLFFGGDLLGSSYAAVFIDVEKNQRQSSESGYLQAALKSNRSNIQVYTHTLATKILFSDNKTAEAVTVRQGNLDFTLSARKEIVLSAGAFQSPQLLMVSGIGPTATLTEHNITLLVDRPGVGQNMWDHIDIEVSWKIDLLGQNSLTSPFIQAQQLAAYHARPPVSIYGSYGVDYIGWEKLPDRDALSSTAKTQLAAFAADWPEVEYEIASVVQSMIPGDHYGYGSFVVIPVSPLSRGTVTLQSDSMLDPPVINPNWLTEPTDMEVALQAVRRGRAIVMSNATAPIRIGDEFFQGGALDISDADLEEYIRNNLFMNWHAACTCKMGMANDTMAVVDSKARVYGVQNLRVVDASSFALLPPGHPMSTVYGFAEKIAADIIGDRDEE